LIDKILVIIVWWNNRL